MREQMKTQTPPMPEPELSPPPPPAAEPPAPRELEEEAKRGPGGVRLVEGEAALEIAPERIGPGDPESPDAGDGATSLPPDWPDPRGFTPSRPCAERPPLRPTDQPVLKHVKLYHGTDAQVTACSRVTFTFATRQDLAVGSLICNVAMITFVSVVTYTSPKC
ncbi:MAG: hypothetical protein QM775_15010 [Pirellulales bacterium]